MMGVAYKLSAVNVPSLTERGAMCIAYCFVGPFPPPFQSGIATLVRYRIVREAGAYWGELEVSSNPSSITVLFYRGVS